jgi:hypothetical protein
MFAGCLQIMSAYLQLMWVEAIGYWQLIRVENTDVCRSCDLCLQVVTASAEKPSSISNCNGLHLKTIVLALESEYRQEYG